MIGKTQEPRPLILTIDDDDMIRFMLKDILSREGFEVVGLAILQEIRTLGIMISIDNFGTGYSSLAYLKKLPISELKVDQSFVRDIPHNEDDKMITSAIIALAKSLSLEVVAEGVENEQQLAFLRQHDCDIVQGDFYSRPLPPEEFSQFVRYYK